MTTTHVDMRHEHHHAHHTEEGGSARYLAPVGRVLYAAIFVLASFGHF